MSYQAALRVAPALVLGLPAITAAPALAAAAPTVAGGALTPDGHGYIVCSSDGGVRTYGDAAFFGSMAGHALSGPVVGCAEDPATGGYWLVGTDGGVFSFGAPFLGSTGGVRLDQPVVGITATPTGRGYWLVARDGGVFAFGDAGFFGSTGGVHLFQPVVGMAAAPDGKGYWLAASDGGVFAFGDARFAGSAYPSPQPVVGIAAAPSGYVLAASDGHLSGYGSSPVSAATPTVAVMSTGAGQVAQLSSTGAAYDARTGLQFPSSGAAQAVSGTPGPAPAGVAGQWALRFDDEFNAGSLDTSKWSTGWLASGVTPPVNSSEQQCYDPAEVREANGSLQLSAVQSSCSVGGRTYPYRSGMVNTDGKAQFTYGFFEARIYLPGSAGRIYNWPAFWTDGQSWPADGEMDVLEGLSGQACWHFHSNAGGPGGCSTADFTGWHTYGADWEPGSVTYYYDGTEVGRITTGITSAPMYLILNDAVSQGQGGPTSPGTMQVDYVRVWQH